ncbi:MAG: ABC transporter ATP-binding protein [Eubacteriales bacterium]|nr:ABC transporter ATP-binding protein [Eubacteriales bacterium]
MIGICNVSKRFESIRALDCVTADIQEGSVYGIVGTNGAGKSTLLRVMCGILKADEGTVNIDGMSVFENVQAKARICFIPDTPYYFINARVQDMMEYYEVIYPGFQEERFKQFCKKFDLDLKRKLSTFSKGMKKQVSVLLGVCSGTKYLMCDETFDGLDPVVRQAVKSIFIDEMMKREFTPIIASHNLREMEDICDHVGLLHKGGILFSKDLEDMKTDIHKVQYVIMDPVLERRLNGELDIIKKEERGTLSCITVRGSKEEIIMAVESKKPLFYEILPLSLEEIFISETEVIGYDIKNLID